MVWLRIQTTGIRLINMPDHGGNRTYGLCLRNTAVQVYFALIQPHSDYCSSAWDGLGETLSTKIQKLQNRAVGVITRSSYDTNASVLLNALQLDNFYVRRKKLKAQLMFRILKGNMPSYLRTLFSIRHTDYNLRNNQLKLNLPKPRTNYSKRSLSYNGALLWNSLPEEMRNLTVFPQFKKLQMIIMLIHIDSDFHSAIL